MEGREYLIVGGERDVRGEDGVGGEGGRWEYDLGGCGGYWGDVCSLFL